VFEQPQSEFGSRGRIGGRVCLLRVQNAYHGVLSDDVVLDGLCVTDSDSLEETKEADCERSGSRVH